MSVVLVVDDEPLLLRAVALALTGVGFDVRTAGTGAAALDAVRLDPPDIVVLDLGLPDLDGNSVVDQAQQLRPELPILVLSARSTSQDKVRALDLGAVDYLAKPFDMGELIARLRAALRRVTPEPTAVTRVGAVEIDLGARSARHDDGEWVHLTPTEWRVLSVLLNAPGRLVGSRELLTAVRGDPDHTDASYLRIYLAQLRKKLEPEPARPRHLLTEAGMGYRFRP